MTKTTSHLNRKARYILGLTFLLFTTIICAAFGFNGNGDYNMARQQLLLRNIGHEILLHSGDSISRVLPVQEINTHEYQLRFENEFTFRTDSLVQIIRRSLLKGNFSDDYIVNVLNCSGKDVLYGFTIVKNEQNNIIPCSGRKQPRACYLINIKFQDQSIITMPKGYLVGGISLFAFIGMLAVIPFRNRKSRSETADVEERDVFQIGNTLFDAKKRHITIMGITTELTPKENKLLHIFSDCPNGIIERTRLQKEIWEDEGVIVGRSLDVFISKLRKKLENDPSIQLVNVHGKGYKLQVSDSAI